MNTHPNDANDSEPNLDEAAETPLSHVAHNGQHKLRLVDLPDPCTSSDFARVIGKSPKTIVDWCQERDYTCLPCFKIGNRWYHRLAELKRWFNGVKSGQIQFRRKPRSLQE
jgi:hypothetical protein